ncbi:MAG: hypothetical protein ACI898_001870 [Flavobacteriales bacterium]|jgi:hypothetical protein
MKTLLTFLCALLTGSLVTAQQTNMMGCAHDLVLSKMAAANPEYQNHCQAQHEYAVKGSKKQSEERVAVVFQIPVVFHIVHNPDFPEQNISDEVIQRQIEILNEDFRRLNPNAVDTREEFLPVAADCEVEFYLAELDNWGNPTNGIDRVETEEPYFFFDIFSTEITLDAVKFTDQGGVDAWNQDEFLNIWVCSIYAGEFAQLFGFAYPPEGAANWEGLIDDVPEGTEGVVVNYTVVGDNNPQANDDNFLGNDGGRVLTHEVGHYLGLRHTWGDGFFDGCAADDGMADTPNIDYNNAYACTLGDNSCDEGEGDLPDMSENYMDYNQDDCVNVFTNDQVNMMRFNLEEFRPELIDGIFVSVNEAILPEIQVYPNPASNLVRINADRKMNVTFHDITGRIVETISLNLGVNELNVQAFEAGVYLIQSEEGLLLERLVIQ